MSDFESMREKHRKDSMIVLSFFVFLFFLFCLHDQYSVLFAQLLEDPSTVANSLWDAWPAFLITLIAPFVTYFVGLVTIARRDLYYTLDNILIGRRNKVDRFIYHRLLRFDFQLSDEDAAGVASLTAARDAKIHEVLGLFYSYIERPDIVNTQLKTHAFIYWGDYFSNLTFVCLGAVASLASLVVLFYDATISGLRIGIWVLMAATIALNVHATGWGRAAKKQFQIPETQIREIHRNAGQQLLEDLRREKFFASEETN